MSRLFFTVILVVLFISCKDEYPGFEKTESGFWKRLNQFGDCAPDLNQCEYYIAEVTLSAIDSSDQVDFTIYNGSLKDKGGYSPGFGNAIHPSVLYELSTLHCGDDVSYIMPYSYIHGSYLSAYDDTLFSLDEPVHLNFHLTQTFDRKAWLKFLVSAARLGEVSEWEAIEMSFLNDSIFQTEVHGDLFIERLGKSSGDTIRPGQELTIEYNTYLLDGSLLDEVTLMRFQYGKPGQLVPGLNYGLSFLGRNDHARIYMPSWLAFGEEGSSTGIIPPQTPVYFDIRVLDVKQ